MSRRVLSKEKLGRGTRKNYCCYLKGCKNREYRLRMCKDHYRLLAIYQSS